LPYYRAPSLGSYSATQSNILIIKKSLSDSLPPSRSMDHTELVEVKARSQHKIGVEAFIGAGIFVLTGLEAKEHAGPAVVLSYVVSGISALLSVFCYTEFAVEIPVAGTYPELNYFSVFFLLLILTLHMDKIIVNLRTEI
jgi:amino acid permease